MWAYLTYRRLPTYSYTPKDTKERGEKFTPEIRKRMVNPDPSPQLGLRVKRGKLVLTFSD
jgi:hypothetical protein